MARLFCGDGKGQAVSAQVAQKAGRATRAATHGAGYDSEGGRRGHCRSPSGGPRLKGSWPQRATRRQKALAGGQRHRPVPVEVARAHLWTQERVPASPHRPSNHRDNHESLHRNGGQGSARIECRGAGAQSRVTFARRACARVRAWKAYVCACARAVRRSGQGGSPSPRQVKGPIQQPISSSTFCLSGELIPTEKKISAIGEKAWQAAHLFMTRSLYAR